MKGRCVMANPVALDLSAAKTLLAFAERAAKNGLIIPDDLQQFIDDPQKMADLVKFIKEERGIDQHSTKPSLLRLVTKVSVGGFNRFVVNNHLKGANVHLTGTEFSRFFVDKVEEYGCEAKLSVSQLKRASLDVQILAELEDKFELMLAHMFGLLEKQRNGEDGILLTNGYVNIFYIRDVDNNLWAVSASWRSHNRCWYVGAYSVGSPSMWNAGSHVFYRDF